MTTQQKTTVIVTMSDGTTRDVSDRFPIGLNDKLFARIVTVTKAAADVYPVSYRNETVTTEITLTGRDKESREYDNHCAAMKKTMGY